MEVKGSHDDGSTIARPAPIDDRTVRRFTRGREQPRGVAWFGARSFWGHLRHLVSAAIASDNIDSRDWMTPDDPEALRSRIAGILGGSAVGNTLTPTPATTRR
jgi:hypothetical protein